MIIRTKGTLLRDQAPPVGEEFDRLIVLPSPTEGNDEYEPHGDEWEDNHCRRYTGSELVERLERAPEAAWLIIREGDPEVSSAAETTLGDFKFRLQGDSMGRELVRAVMTHPGKPAVSMDIPWDELAEFVLGEIHRRCFTRRGG